jgi:hypothetical protein
VIALLLIHQQDALIGHLPPRSRHRSHPRLPAHHLLLPAPMLPLLRNLNPTSAPPSSSPVLPLSLARPRPLRRPTTATNKVSPAPSTILSRMSSTLPPVLPSRPGSTSKRLAVTAALSDETLVLTPPTRSRSLHRALARRLRNLTFWQHGGRRRMRRVM